MAIANYYFSFNVMFLGLCLQLLLHVSSSTEAGFFADVIHRDSPESPLHNSSSTSFSRLHASVQRSTSRVDYLRHSHVPHFNYSSGLFASLMNDKFEFLVSFYIGSNNEKAFAGIDTGGSLIWVLCDPCDDCYEHTPAIFQSSSSQSYRQHPCKIHPCTLHPNTTCTNTQSCEYHAQYLDKSFVIGILSTDKFGLNLLEGNGIHDLHDIIFGCTHMTKGSFNKGGIGLIGLNRAPLSLVSQLGPTFGRRFSYCFPRKVDRRSRINFGTAATVSGPGTMTTSMFHGSYNNIYYLLLDTITIGKMEPIVVSTPQGNHQGNIIIDSGAMFTYISQMQDLSEMVKAHIPLPTKQHDQYDLCFDTSDASGDMRWLPKVTFNFVNDAKFVLSKKSTFAKIDKNTLCLLILSSSRSGGLQILGNRAQLGYLIGYFDDVRKLSFRKNAC